jgi:asparagine synthase (glutamine-hydrolysing)
MARQHVTVALSGLGGDEAFAGYERYLGFRLGQWYARVPPWFRSHAIAPLVNRLPELAWSGNRVNHVKRFVRSAVDDDARRYLGFVRKLGSHYGHSLFAANGRLVDAAREGAEARFLQVFREANADDPLDRVFYCDAKTYLPDDILALTDRLSMCHSLEVRVPFLDHQLFEFTATIPSDLKLKWLRKKYLLKRALADRVPAPVLTHRKQGFVGPLPEWLRGELRSHVIDALAPRNLSRHGLFDEATVTRVLSDHFEGRELNDTLIWALLVFQTWFDVYIDERVPAALEPLGA